MRAKDKKRKYIFFTLRNIIIFSIVVISIFYIIIFYHYYFGESVVYATEVSSPVEELTLSKAERIDIDSYIENNSKEGVKEEYTVEEVELEFITKYKNNATFLVRGIRNGMDYEYEENMASINEELSGLDTVYIRAGNLGNISSSMVMDLLRNGKDVSKYLPKEIIDIVK